MTLNKADLYKVASDSYYMKPEMVKFLLIENLTLKTLLHEKGLITPEEFAEANKRAEEILEAKAKQQMTEHLKNMMKGAKDGHGPDDV